MRALNKQKYLISLCLLFICILCICYQMIINYTHPYTIIEVQSTVQEVIGFEGMDAALNNNNAHFLQDSELLTNEISKGQLIKIEDFNMTMWNVIILIKQLIRQLIAKSEVLLFTYLICRILRFMITYRYKQDGKKQNFIGILESKFYNLIICNFRNNPYCHYY